MHTVRTELRHLETLRIDPAYYHPMHLQDAVTLESFGSDPMGLAGKFFTGPFGSKLPSHLYLDAGVPLFRVGNVGSMEVNMHDMAYLHPAIHEELKSSEVGPGDLLIVKASVGEKICKVPDWIDRANITQHIIAVRSNGYFDTDYLSAFLFGQYGRRQLIRRSLGSIIQYLGVNDARTILVPSLDSCTQTYIGNKVRQAEQLRARVSADQIAIEILLADFNPQVLAGGRTSRIANSLIEDSLNPNAYMPAFIEAEKIVQNFDHATLKEVSISVSDGPFGSNLKVEDYRTDKNAEHPVVRVLNCVNGIFKQEDLVWIDSKKQAELNRSVVVPGDLLVTKAGRIGSAAVYPDSLPNGNITSHLIRARLRNEYDVNYVAEYFETKVGKAITLRHSFKSTRPELTKTEIENCSIPFLEEPIVNKVGFFSRRKSLNTRLSILLISAAKFFVEALIDGQLFESDLIAAQKALEVGDHTPDREILSRLTRKGIDAAAEPPLFSDLDELHRALDVLNMPEEAS